MEQNEYSTKHQRGSSPRVETEEEQHGKVKRRPGKRMPANTANSRNGTKKNERTDQQAASSWQSTEGTRCRDESRKEPQ